jgi:uncharacterized protein
MPAKKSSKKSSKARETTLVPHAAPQLASLLERAKGGKRSDVQQYLNAGGSPNVLVQVQLTGTSTVPLLCGLVLSEHREAAESVKLLLQSGAAADATFLDDAQREHIAPLIACELGDLTILQALLDGGAYPCYQTSSDYKTALHAAAMKGCVSTCRALIAASSGRALELELKDGRSTPLIAACANNHEAVVKLLCTLGADVTHTDACGNTALMVAANAGCSVTLLQFLLQQRGVSVNQTEEKGVTAVAAAACSGSAAAVRVLLEHGADATIQNFQGHCAMFAQYLMDIGT